MVCRVCFKSSELELEIFDKNGVEQRIPDILQLHLWFTPSPNDPISKVVCLTCWCKLLEFNQFYEAAKEAQKFYSEQHGIHISREATPELSHPVEVVEAVFNVKHEDTNDEKWLSGINPDKTQNNESNEAEVSNVINPLYEPELLDPIIVKAESPEANNLDETATSKERNRNSKQNEQKEEKNDKIESDTSDEDDFEDDDNSQSDYEPETEEFISTTSPKATCSKTTKLRKRRGRPPTEKVKSSSTANSSKEVKNPRRKSKHEKRSWSGPKDDEMVKKHLPLNCEICGFHVENYTEMIRHFQTQHKNVRAYIFCCGRRLSKRQRVVQHAYRHEDPNYFQCQICKKNFSDNYVLRSHMLAHHPDEDELLYKCDQCEKRFSRRYLLELHKPVHIPVAERKFVCPKCPTAKAFASDHLLKIHDSMRHKRAANVCHVCAKSIRDNQAFEKHVRLHFEESGPRVKCPRPGCDRWLKDEDNLKQHLRRHNDEGKIITCDQCGKSVKNRRALSSHISYAHSTSLYSCEECKKTFKKAITLKEHMAQHTGETLYKCPFCPRTFNSNANMHSHKKKMHPVEWDIWRKTKTGSSQSLKSNVQVLETVANSLISSSTQGMTSMEQPHMQELLNLQQQQQQVEHKNVMY